MVQKTQTNKKNAVIIVAAGRGSRMADGDGPKQYRKINGKAILQKTVEAFDQHPDIDIIQVVIHPDDKALYQDAVRPSFKLLNPVIGGATRQVSAFEGLKALTEQNITKALIHDAARPFVDDGTITRVLEASEKGVCALPALPINETIKHAPLVDGMLRVEKTISRQDLYAAQTPQGFVYNDILEAHRSAEEAGNTAFTDDAAVFEAGGGVVRIVDGNAENTKITTQSDLEKYDKMDEVNAYSKMPDVRTGNGYDVHRLVAGDGVILCGVTIPSKFKLDGHSDADVGLHALTDALLGTIGSGDIGSHFPPSDAKWKGAKSDQFLQHACELVREKSGIITHVDITIICEQPKIGPHREAMREEVARICKLDISRVSVKATTNETIGSIGRGEGIAALATATVVIL